MSGTDCARLITGAEASKPGQKFKDADRIRSRSRASHPDVIDRKFERHVPALWLLLLALGCAHTPPATRTAAAGPSAKSAAFSTPKLDLLDGQIKASPNDPVARSNRGYVLALLGRKDEARADLRETLRIKDTPALRNRVGWAYFNMGDYTDALREFELSAGRDQHRAHFHYYSLVLGYWGAGDMRHALENYQLAVERDPRFGEFKTLNDRIAEWTPLERRAMHEVYALWSKTWRP